MNQLTLTQKKAWTWVGIVGISTIAGKVIDHKHFGIMEGALVGLGLGAIVTAYMDTTSLPATGESAGNA